MMNGNFKRRLAWTQRPKWGVVFLMSMLIVTNLIYGNAPSFAQDPTPTPNMSSAEESGHVPAPPGDCWNEALSRDPIHCYFLEEAQRAGKIEVAAVYLAPGGGPLYIFLEQITPITDEVAQFFEAMAHEYLEREYDAGRTNLPLERCIGYTGDEKTICLNEVLARPSWRGFESPRSRALPVSRIYESILVDVGGTAGRQEVPGWASWHQVWPAVASGAAGSGGFDVSDVDLANIAAPDCERAFPGSGLINQSCHAWKFDKSVGIAGVYSRTNALYVQLKVSDPNDEAEMQALVDRLHSDYFVPGVEVITTPVKYDFGELWRWSVILSRFAVSAGNTVGITDAQVGYNSTALRANDDPLVWMNGVEPRTEDETGSDWDWTTVRNILIVWARDPQVATAALPELLPALGIPVDAVGLVAHDDTTPVIAELAVGYVEAAPNAANSDDKETDAPTMDTQSSGASKTQARDGDSVGGPPSPRPVDGDRANREFRWWIFVGGGLFIGLVILGTVLGVSPRLRRRPS